MHIRQARSEQPVDVLKYEIRVLDHGQDAQIEQQAKFAKRQAVATAWLNANKPGTTNGEKGTSAYQYAQRLKRQFSLSNINQVLYRYMDDKNVITLPEDKGI